MRNTKFLVSFHMISLVGGVLGYAGIAIPSKIRFIAFVLALFIYIINWLLRKQLKRDHVLIKGTYVALWGYLLFAALDYSSGILQWLIS